MEGGHINVTEVATRLRRTQFACFCLGTLLLACGSDTRPRAVRGREITPPFVPTSGDLDAGTGPTLPTGGSGGAGGSSGSGGENSGGTSGAMSQEDASTTPSLVPPRCGDGQVNQENEQCDQQTLSCFEFGFDTGEATCTANCTWDLSACSGAENCFDGRDNDGDGLVDCLDTVECDIPCQDPCLDVPVLSEIDSVQGSTDGHSTLLSASCTSDGGGAAVVYRVDTPMEGKFDVGVDSSANLTVSFSSTCGNSQTELSCSNAARLTMDVLSGAEVYVTVQGASPTDSGSFSLRTDLRQQACGDQIREFTEACDDGNINDGDGCDPDCNLETLEQEPANDLPTGADPYPFGDLTTAEIRPAGDTDYYSLTLTDERSTLVVETRNLGDGACGLKLMDTVIDVLDNQNGNELIVSNDNGADGLCSRATAPGLLPGTYFVRVTASNTAFPDTFPYDLSVSVATCGDGSLGLGEECDDGALVDGDGCSAICQVES